MSRHGQVEAVAKARATLEWAVDLGCRIWTAHVGVMPMDTAFGAVGAVSTTLGHIACYGEKIGGVLAIETGPEPPFLLRQMLDEMGGSGIGVNYDPARTSFSGPPGLAKRSGQPYQREAAVETLPAERRSVGAGGPDLVHTHAKDALVREDGQRQEVPLGEGWVDWPRYVANLRSIGYRGYFAIGEAGGGRGSGWRHPAGGGVPARHFDGARGDTAPHRAWFERYRRRG